MSFLNRLKNNAANSIQQGANQVARQAGNAAAQQISGTISGATPAQAAPAGSIGSAGSQEWVVVFQDVPTSLAELRACPEASLAEPYYAAALLIPALCTWSVNQMESQAMLNFLKGPEALTNRDIQFINDRLKGKEYVPQSYFAGAIPENNYEPTQPYTVTILTNPYSYDEAGYVKFFIRSGGADSPRPLKVRQKPSTGEWFLWEHHLLPDIRIPVSADPWV